MGSQNMSTAARPLLSVQSGASPVVTPIQPRNSIAPPCCEAHSPRIASQARTPRRRSPRLRLCSLNTSRSGSFQRPRSSPEPRHLHWRGWLRLWLWPAPCFLQAPSRTQHNTRARSRRGIMMVSDSPLSRGAIATRSRWSDRQRSVPTAVGPGTPHPRSGPRGLTRAAP